MTKSIPAGRHSVTPRLVVHDVARLVEFLKQAFGATGDFRTEIPCEIRIGDSLVMVSAVGTQDPKEILEAPEERNIWLVGALRSSGAKEFFPAT